MSEIKDNEIAIRARNLLTEQEEAQGLSIPRIRAAIKTALERWAREAFNDREKRELLKKRFTPSVTAGLLDLANYLNGSTGKINLKELRQTTIYDETTSPYTWVSSFAQLTNTRPLGGDSKVCYLEGSRLHLRSKTGTAADQSISFTVTSYPCGVSQIPHELVQDFVVYLAGMFSNGNS